MQRIFLPLFALSMVLVSFSSRPKESTPSSPDYILDYNAGVAAQKNQDYQGAIDNYLSALDKKGDFADAWNNLGYCYRMVAKSYLDKSGDAYSKALKYAPQNAWALEYQGEYFLMMGQLKKAYQNYLQLQNRNPQMATLLKGKLDDVLSQAQTVLQSQQASR